MRRSLFSALAPLLLIAACAPAPTSRAPSAAPAFSAAFAPEGVAWMDQGQACVARAPSYRPVCPRLPGRVAAVGWNRGNAWAALPGVGLLVTLDLAARSVPVGRVVALSATRAYREDGSAVTYDGNAATGVSGAPSAAVTGGDGQDYVLLAGALVRVADGTVLERVAGPLLEVTPTGARSTNLPSVTTLAGTYRLTGTALERLDAAGRVLKSVPHGPGRVGVVGGDLVTVSPGGAVRVFGSDLQPVSR
ncbi:hypothetical protein DAERI_030294 [Deinococcus aerius]|uniref:Lipoprotein n=1 Tax=Deinococcus aerius TaxID=200253 RepID=A0A2I9DG86_9DEIO|nr:hypothetical protein [Deinococcus aerius]GBF05128.1 hypothetical protein DAERI_030294 [Deinococcus aerius]